jgi:hypothetical protein
MVTDGSRIPTLVRALSARKVRPVWSTLKGKERIRGLRERLKIDGEGIDPLHLQPFLDKRGCRLIILAFSCPHGGWSDVSVR